MMKPLILAMAMLPGQVDPLKLPEEEKRISPGQVWVWAYQDLSWRVPDPSKKYIRYFSIHDVYPQSDRIKLYKTLSGHCNQLSSKSIRIYRPYLVPNTESSLIRVDTRYYSWDLSIFEKLTTINTMFRENRVDIEFDSKIIPGTPTKEIKRTVTNGFASWVNSTQQEQAATKYLHYYTESETPVISGSQFLHQTAVQEGRVAGYYDFLGIKDEATFQKLVRFNAETSNKLEHLRVLVWSDVLQKPRRVRVDYTALGPFFKTFDNIIAKGKNNPVETLDDEFQFVATEQLSLLSNGMLGSYLGNNKGARQDKAPDNIHRGDRTSEKDIRLHVNLSCVRCHLARDKDWKGYIDLKDAKIEKIESFDEEKKIELEDRYFRTFQTKINYFRATLEEKIFEATGMTCQEYGSEYSRWYIAYDEAHVDADYVGKFFGYSQKQVVDCLKHHKSKGAILPQMLTIIMNGGAIPIENFEEVTSPMYAILAATYRKEQ